MTRAALIVLLAACNAPAPSLDIAFAGPPSQACPSTDCAGVPMMCSAVMSIRIVDPPDVDPEHPLLEQCVEMPQNNAHNMCVVGTVDLITKPLPVRDLEVQVAVFPSTVIGFDQTDMTPHCPNTVQYSASTGFPIEQAPTPALGGHAYYHPGDQTVTVTLGCTDLSALNDWCAAPKAVEVAASLENFKDRFPVTDVNIVDQLEVSVGEPHALNNAYELNPNDTSALTPQINGNGRPTWEGEARSPLSRYACIKVRDNAAQSTATVTCQLMDTTQPLDLLGELMAKDQLDALLKALLLPGFPAQGLTIGIVVDQVGDPIPGAVISARQHKIAYQATDTAFSGTATSDLGVFVSIDAPFGTEFSTEVTIGGTRQSLSGIGGLIEGMVTIVVLRPAGLQL